MILLRPDCLVFETPTGESIPCSATDVTVELMGEAVDSRDRELIQEAAAAVLHYFRQVLGRTSVSLAEFSQALDQALANLGIKAKLALSGPVVVGVAETDLLGLGFQSGKGCELFFFRSLREEVHRKLELRPQMVVFRGLRVCVMQLTGCKRWGRRCQRLSDQIVEYLRTCLSAEKAGGSCVLVVK